MDKLIVIVVLAARVLGLALPLPDFTNKAAVTAWLAKLGVGQPLSDLIIAIIPDSPIIVGATPDAVAVADAVQAEGEKAGLDPALIALLIQVVQWILSKWNK